MKFDHQSRLKKLRRGLVRRRLDGFLSVGRENIYYLCGFSGVDSWLLITAEREILITDFRFQEQADAILPPECEVSLRTRKSLSAKAVELCRDLSLKKIGFEERHLSYGEFYCLKKALRSRELMPVGELVEALRMMKDPEEIILLRRSARMTTRVLSMVMKGLTPSLTEFDVAGRINIGLLRDGGRSAFPPIVAAGTRSSQPHAVASYNSIGVGNVLLIDMGAESEVYNSDMTRTFVLGNFPRKFKTIYRAVLGAQKKAIRAIRPGVQASLVDGAARRYLEERGYGRYFGHSLGHGVGLEVHERPAISSRSRDVIKEGMVFTVEPGVYIPGWGGIRIEDTVLVTANGCEILTEYPKDLESMVIKKT
jgi:Xaa-Pro aminopeptidase